jgi:SNF2 family DNA or RNA helicase
MTVGSQEIQGNEVDESEERDIYDTLEPAEDQPKDGFRYEPTEKLYYLPGGFSLPPKIYENLYEHQKLGIKWLYQLYRDELGGVLADDMGLGKTVQICAYLKGLFDSEQIKKAIIVVPATMKSYWQTELNKWCIGAPNIMSFEDKKKSDREQQIRRLKKQGGVLVTSYGMVTSEKINLSEMRYDVLVVDEGHKAKNINTELRRNLVALRVKGHRLILTGTPLQNNLSELWSVFDFIQPKIFGSFNRFTREYAEVIERGLLKDASARDKAKATDLSAKLRQMYEPHFLRRTKNQIFKVVSAELIGRPLKTSELPLKTDLVVWLPLSESQAKIYRFMLEN